MIDSWWLIASCLIMALFIIKWLMAIDKVKAIRKEMDEIGISQEIARQNRDNTQKMIEQAKELTRNLPEKYVCIKTFDKSDPAYITALHEIHLNPMFNYFLWNARELHWIGIAQNNGDLSQRFVGRLDAIGWLVHELEENEKAYRDMLEVREVEHAEI